MNPDAETRGGVGLWLYPRTKSPKRWRPEAEAWAHRNGLEIDRHYELSADTWFDMLAELRTDFRSGRVHTIIAERIDVLSPSLPAFADIMRVIGTANGRLVLLHNDVDTAAEDPQTVFRLFSAMARWETQSVATRRLRVRGAVVDGQIAGRTPAPFGYRWLTGRLIPDPIERKTCRLVFDLYAEEPNAKLVAITLSGRGEVLRGGRRFFAANVRAILRDPTAAGRFPGAYTLNATDDRWRLENSLLTDVEAIVPIALWETCNDLLDEEELWR